MSNNPIFDAIAAEQGRDQAFADLDAADKAAELEAILAVIEQHASKGAEFTANEVRPDLPEGVNQYRVGRAFARAIELGIIQPVAIARSNKRSTHNARINRYRAASGEQVAS